MRAAASTQTLGSFRWHMLLMQQVTTRIVVAVALLVGVGLAASGYFIVTRQ